MQTTVRATCPKCASPDLEVQIVTPPTHRTREFPRRETSRFLSPLKAYVCRGCGERFTRSW